MTYRFFWNIEGHGITEIDAKNEDEAVEKFVAAEDSEIIRDQDYEIEIMSISEEGEEDGDTD